MTCARGWVQGGRGNGEWRARAEVRWGLQGILRPHHGCTSILLPGGSGANGRLNHGKVRVTSNMAGLLLTLDQRSRLMVQISQPIVLLRSPLRLSLRVQSLGMGGRMLLHMPPLVPGDDYGTHHSKFFILAYERGVRVIIHTANAVMPQGECSRTEGV